jgi:hypothetical protein
MIARNLTGGFAVALVLAAPFIVPSIDGVATWKILMGVAGLWIFVRAGMNR